MEPLFLDGPAPAGPGASLATPAAVNVHPVVLFSILEQHLRREEGQDRVIGSCCARPADGGIDTSGLHRHLSGCGTSIVNR